MSNIVKCSPVEMRKSLVMVDTFKASGIEFIPIPVSSKLTKDQLLALMLSQLECLEADANKGV